MPLGIVEAVPEADRHYAGARVRLEPDHDEKINGEGAPVRSYYFEDHPRALSYALRRCGSAAVLDKSGQQASEPWIMNAVSIALRIAPGTVAERAAWARQAERQGRKYVRLFPSGAPAEIEAAVLHGLLQEGGTQPRHLLQLGVRRWVITMLQATVRPAHLPYVAWIRLIVSLKDPALARVMLAVTMHDEYPEASAMLVDALGQ